MSSATSASTTSPISGFPQPPRARPLRPTQKSFFLKALFAPVKKKEFSTSDDDSVVPRPPPRCCKYIPLGDGSVDMFGTENIIIRPCYDHLLPQIHNRMVGGVEDGGCKRIAITGTPGIGKSLFGIVLVRHYLNQKQTVLYWVMDDVYMFSFDPTVAHYFSLSEFAPAKTTAGDGNGNDGRGTCYAGYWLADAALSYGPLLLPDVSVPHIVIHDPKTGDDRVALQQNKIGRLIYTLSYGHSLIDYWIKKKIPMGKNYKYYLPLWTKEEAARSLPLLGCEEGADPDALYRQYGGCIRGWISADDDDDDFDESLTAKIVELVNSYGPNALAQHTDPRGPVIHMFVDFDEDRVRVPYDGAPRLDAIDTDDDDVKMQDVVATTSDPSPNNFFEFEYIFGSDGMLREFDRQLVDTGGDALDSCLRRWSSSSGGFESVYGALFELRCHQKLDRGKGRLTLKMRLVFEDASKNRDAGTFTFPPFTTVRYRSNDPAILRKDKACKDKVLENHYLVPLNCNHPTYDAAVVVNAAGLDIPDPGIKFVALLLQMTVSGATGLPRRPQHAVMQSIRKEFNKVFTESGGIPGYGGAEGDAYTAFMVPTECFEPFQFQKECKRDGDVCARQPAFQIVFEMPGIFAHKKVSPRANSKKGKKRHYHQFDPAVSTDPLIDSAPVLDNPPLSTGN